MNGFMSNERFGCSIESGLFHCEIADGVKYGCSNEVNYFPKLTLHDTGFSIPDVFEKKQEETQEDTKMSLVGIMNNPRVGLVAFGDSRGSIVQHGELTNGPTPYIKKVFRGERFLLATYGANEYVKNGSLMPLASLLEQTITTYPNLSYDEFLKNIQRELAETFIADPNVTYHFICGFRDDLEEKPCYGTEFCDIDRVKINFKGVNFLRHIAYGGNTDMMPQRTDVNTNWSMEEMENVCNSLMNHCISLGNLFFPYNPVGLPVQIEKLR